MTDFDRPAIPGHPGWICPTCGDWTATSYRCSGTCERDLTDVSLQTADARPASVGVA